MVIGSGYQDYTGEIEIYSQNDNSFQYGPTLPKSLEGAASVQYGDSFIVVGGLDNYCYCDNSGITIIACYSLGLLLSMDYVYPQKFYI